MNLDDRLQIYQFRVQIHFRLNLSLPLQGCRFLTLPNLNGNRKFEVGNLKILYAAVFSIFLGIHMGLKPFHFSVFQHMMEKPPTLPSLQVSFFFFFFKFLFKESVVVLGPPPDLMNPIGGWDLEISIFNFLGDSSIHSRL